MTDKEEKKDSVNGDAAAEETKETKTTDWPLKNIADPHAHDVLYGRGGGTNHHPGNKRYRKMVEDRKLDYVNSKRLDKPLVALDIIREWRNQDPPGRFLKMDDKTGLWNDVGDKKAREKTSQALREKAPQIRAALEEEKHAKEHGEDGTADGVRFAEGTNTDEKVTKALLARDHSLGREILEPGDAVTLEGFSWQEPFVQGQERTISGGSGSGAGHGQPPMPVPPPMPPQGYPMGSMGSMTSMGSWQMRYQSGSSIPGPPPPPGAYPSPRYDSWGSNGPIPSFGYPMPPPGGGPPQPTNSWGPRDHSLGAHALPHASVAQATPYQTFDARAASGQWGAYPPPPPPRYGAPPPPTPYQNAGGLGAPPHSPTSPPSPPYAVDPAVAQQWSGQDPSEIARTYSGEDDPYRKHPNTVSQGSEHSGAQASNMPKPEIVKRMTSNQNETVETRPSVKRAALNRDNSMASNRLKEQYIPGYDPNKSKNRNFNPEREIQQLSDNLRQTSVTGTLPRQSSLTEQERTSTIDRIAMDLMVKPVVMSSTNRSTTIEALGIDFADELMAEKPGAAQRTSTMESVFSELRGDGLPKPSTITGVDRMTTTELLDIVNEPLVDDEADVFSGQQQAV